MEKTIAKIKEQLRENWYVSKEDIESLLDYIEELETKIEDK